MRPIWTRLLIANVIYSTCHSTKDFPRPSAKGGRWSPRNIYVKSLLYLRHGLLTNTPSNLSWRHLILSALQKSEPLAYRCRTIFLSLPHLTFHLSSVHPVRHIDLFVALVQSILASSSQILRNPTSSEIHLLISLNSLNATIPLFLPSSHH